VLFFLLFAGCIVAFIGFAQYAIWYSMLLHRRLLKHGAVADGEIAEIATYAWPGWPWHDITFRYPLGEVTFSVWAARRDAHGKPQRCALFYRPRMLGGMPVPGAEVGDPVTVLYDPAHPSRAVPYEFSYFRCNRGER